jgi:MYXO-CTERM domain-containing protein
MIKNLLCATSILVLGTALAAQNQPASTDANDQPTARQPVRTENNNWGWIGLLGLGGLAGLKRRESVDYERDRIRSNAPKVA